MFLRGPRTLLESSCLSGRPRVSIYSSYLINFITIYFTFIAHSRALLGRTTVSRLGYRESKHSFALSSCLQRVTHESFSGFELEACKGLDTFAKGENFGGVERNWSSIFRVERRFFSVLFIFRLTF